MTDIISPMTNTMTLQTKTLLPTAWKLLARSLKHERCILIVGAGISVVQQNNQVMPIGELLANKLAQQIAEYRHPKLLGNTNDLLYVATEFASIYGRSYLEMEVEDFYANYQQASPIHDLIAGLPFSLIINTAPDDLIERAFDKIGRGYQSAYFHLNDPKLSSTSSADFTPSPQCPVIYHLFGKMEDPSSLVLTNKEQLDFVETFIQSANNLKRNAVFREFERPNQRFILTGFDFEQWHLRILLWLLRLNKTNDKEPPIVPNILDTSTDILLFFKNLYNAHFVTQSPVDFFTKLSEEYKKTQKKQDKPIPKPLKAIILYQQKDDFHKVELNKYLKTLREKGTINSWDEGELLGGDEIVPEIKQKIEQADVIIVLVSIDFINSDAYETQWQYVLEKHRQQKTVIFPILVRQCPIDDTSFAALDTRLPRNGQPLNQQKDQAAALTDIVNEIKKTVVQRLKHA